MHGARCLLLLLLLQAQWLTCDCESRQAAALVCVGELHAPDVSPTSRTATSLCSVLEVTVSSSWD